MKRLLLLILICIWFASGQSVAKSLQPFIGIDYQYRDLPDKNTSLQTKHIFSHYFHSKNLYFGNKFKKNWGIELGFQHSAIASATKYFAAGEQFGSDTESANDKLNTKIQVRGFQLDFDGFIPVGKIEALGQIGIAWLKPQATALHKTYIGGADADLNLRFTRRAIAHVGFGARAVYKLVGLRAMFRWENTSRLIIEMTDEDQNPYKLRPFRNGYTLMGGIFIQL